MDARQNGLENHQSSICVLFYLTEPPKVIVSPKNQSFTEGSEVSISCSATGYPKPTVVWTHNDMFLMASNRYVQGLSSPTHQQSLPSLREKNEWNSFINNLCLLWNVIRRGPYCIISELCWPARKYIDTSKYVIFFKDHGRCYLIICIVWIYMSFTPAKPIWTNMGRIHKQKWHVNSSQVVWLKQ